MTFPNPFPPVQQQLTALTSVVDCPIEAMTFERQSLLMCELSCLAYFDAPGTESWGQKIGFARVSKTILNATGLSVSIFTTDTDIVMSFRGTDNLMNFVQDVDYHQVKDGNLPGAVHKGFLDDFETLWPTVVPLLVTKKKLWSTGHSLGGAMAAIAAVRASRRDGPCVAGLFTYGQPRIGDKSYVTDVTTKTIRYVNHQDIVPQLPPRWMNFQHFGKEVYINADGLVKPKNVVSRLLGFVSSLFIAGLEDHNIVSYRAAIAANQESANGQR